jgi:menaquinol-cytochrome c reductase iron-sulfur subunit
MSEDNQVSRKNFMEIAIWSIGGVIALGMTIPAIAYLVGPAIRKAQEQVWLRLGSVLKVEIGVPTLFKVKVQQRTGWIVNEEEISVYVLTEDGRNYIAMSNICTHLGCRVRWIAEQNSFFCPCHNAIFDQEGGVVSGPPPEPLERYEVKVEDNQLYILGG